MALARFFTWDFSSCCDTTIPVMLDWESDTWINKQGQVVREFFPTFDDVVAVSGEMRSLGTKVVTLYTGAGYWAKKGSPRLTGNGFDLVNARWGKNLQVNVAADHYGTIGGDTGTGWEGYGGLEPIIWQFGSAIKFGSKHMDHNACRAWTSWSTSPSFSASRSRASPRTTA